MEKTFAMIKPDAVQRGLVGTIISRYEAKGLRVAGMKIMQVTEEIAKQHYAEHVEKPFFPGLLSYITSGPVVALVLEGKNAVAEVRKMNGATNPLEAACGTIRGDFAQEVGRNVVHGSDSVESAAREIAIYFNDNEVLEYDYLPAKWLFDNSQANLTKRLSNSQKTAGQAFFCAALWMNVYNSVHNCGLHWDKWGLFVHKKIISCG